VNGVVVAPQTDPDTGEIVIPVSAGHSDVRIWFGHTPDRAAGAAVSLCSLGVLLVFAQKSPTHRLWRLVEVWGFPKAQTPKT
jgi:hypothetical protein